MNEMVKTADALGAEIRSLTYQAKCMTVYYGVEIGRRLTAAKSMVGHGEWGDWIKRETEFSQTTATRFMRVFEEYGADQIGIFGAVPNSPTLQNLNISNAIALLSVPKEEREAFAEEVDAEHKSVRELEKIIKERDMARQERDQLQRQTDTWEQRAKKAQDDLLQMQKETGDAAEEIKAANEEAGKLRQKVRELEARKPEVQTVRDEAAIKEAAEKAKAAADAEWKKQIETQKAADEQHQKQIEKLQADLAAALEKAKSASDAAEKKQLAEEVEKLKKQLAMADKEVTAAGLHFQSWQSAYNQMTGAVERIEDETKADKLRAAIRAQLSAWMKTMEG